MRVVCCSREEFGQGGCASARLFGIGVGATALTILYYYAWRDSIVDWGIGATIGGVLVGAALALVFRSFWCLVGGVLGGHLTMLMCYFGFGYHHSILFQLYLPIWFSLPGAGIGAAFLARPIRVINGCSRLRAQRKR